MIRTPQDLTTQGVAPDPEEGLQGSVLELWSVLRRARTPGRPALKLPGPPERPAAPGGSASLSPRAWAASPVCIQEFPACLFVNHL